MLSQWKKHLPSVVMILLITTYTSRAFAFKKYHSKWNTLDVIILIQQSRNLHCRDSVCVHMMSQNRPWVSDDVLNPTVADIFPILFDVVLSQWRFRLFLSLLESSCTEVLPSENLLCMINKNHYTLKIVYSHWYDDSM